MPTRQAGWAGSAACCLLLPDEQQIKRAVLKHASCAATAIAVDRRGEIRSARAPACDMAGTIIAKSICRDLHVAAGAPRATAADTRTCDRIGAGRSLGNADASGSILRVKRISRAWLVGYVDRGRRVICPNIAHHIRPVSYTHLRAHET